jgi:hypothetical protein
MCSSGFQECRFFNSIASHFHDRTSRMASPTADYEGFRHYRRPSIRAKFQTHRKKSEEDLKEALRSANQQQRHVLHSASSWQSSCDDRHTIRSVHAILPHQSRRVRPVWLSATASATSTSSTNLGQNAAPQTPCNVDQLSPGESNTQELSQWFPDEKLQPQPAAKLERRPARRDARKLEKDKRKEEKEAKKAQKAQEKHERKELQRRVTEARARNTTTVDARPVIDGEDPYSNKSTTMHAWKRPLLKLGSHSKRGKQVIPMPGDFSSKSDLAAYLNPIDETPSIPQIPELPAGPPPYNPLESSDLPDPNNTSSSPHDVSTSRNDERIEQQAPLIDAVQHNTYHGSCKPMLCDSCHCGIGLLDVFYQCKECDDGDRIICAACAEAGRRCRHELFTKISSVKRTPGASYDSSRKVQRIAAVQGSQTTKPTPNDVLQPTTHLQNSSGKPSLALDPLVENQTTPDGDQVFAAANADMQKFEAFQRVQEMFREMKIQDDYKKSAKGQELLYLHHKQHLIAMQEEQQAASRRQQELALRERAVVLREQEAALREQESALREQRAAFREREAALREQERVRWSQTPSSASQQRHGTVSIACHACHNPKDIQIKPEIDALSSAGDAASMAGISTAVPSLIVADVPQKDAMQTIRQMVKEILAGSVPRIHLDDGRIQTHAHAGSKRKAGTDSGGSSASSNKFNQPIAADNYFGRSDGHEGEEEEDDDDDQGTPKRRKQSPIPAVNVTQRLLACPYAKCDPIRYSERNVNEKQYRGCSGRYLTDISRLKQHLYRVHQRPEHACPRCFEVFKSKDLLDLHARQPVLCQVSECHFGEKFAEDKMKELKRKRPGKSVEESWYIIFRILFPDAALPESPYVDDLPCVPSVDMSANAEASQTLNLLEIFNEQLSQHQNAEAHSWLASREARDLINHTLALSMTELLRRMSPTNTPSVGRTPSIFISPTSAQPRSTIQTPRSVVSENIIPRKAISPGEEIIAKAPTAEDDWPSSPGLTLPDIGDPKKFFGRDEYDYDNDIFGPAISEPNNFNFIFQESEDNRRVDNDGHSGSTFMPVKVSSLNDVVPESNADVNSTSLKMTCSKRSLDSGYGSMHSRNRLGEPVSGKHFEPERASDAVIDDDLTYLSHGLYETLAQDYMVTPDLEYWREY